MDYDDLTRLPFMTQCVMETLRLWPAVPNGTFREMQFDDVITGPGGKDVKVPKGTYVQILTWPRHRNKDLWGEDADEFNPVRYSPCTMPLNGCGERGTVKVYVVEQ
jgi:cytochrome P450